jgi:hypothetical protein
VTVLYLLVSLLRKEVSLIVVISNKSNEIVAIIVIVIRVSNVGVYYKLYNSSILLLMSIS